MALSRADITLPRSLTTAATYRNCQAIASFCVANGTKRTTMNPKTPNKSSDREISDTQKYLVVLHCFSALVVPLDTV